MARDWHEVFKTWAKPPSETEEEKGSNAARMINEAVRSTRILDGRTFTVYPTGSYRNNTNVRAGSDVDVALVLQEAFFYTLPNGLTAENVGLGMGPPPKYALPEFRADIHRALVMKFGSDVKPGDKTFDIEGNSYRLPADATPFLLHRHYTGQRRADGSWEYIEGVETRPATGAGSRIINWHQAHYDRGVARNAATNRRFKRVTRILKRLRAEMRATGTQAAKTAAEPVASFLIECLVYNAPNTCFNIEDGSYYKDVRAVIAHGWNQTKEDAAAAKLVEVSERKPLFSPQQKWTRMQAHDFLLHAWQHVGFPS